MLVDTHCHLNIMVKKQFDIPLTIDMISPAQKIADQAAAQGVTTIINVGTSLIESKNSVLLAQNISSVYATVGIHPNDCTVSWKKELNELEMEEKHLIQLLKLIEAKKITDTTAQKLLEKLIEKPFDVSKYVEEKSLEAVSDTVQLEEFCREAVEENPKAAEDYKKGGQKAFNFIVGAVMKKSKGKATPAEVNSILKRLLKS